MLSEISVWKMILVIALKVKWKEIQREVFMTDFPSSLSSDDFINEQSLCHHLIYLAKSSQHFINLKFKISVIRLKQALLSIEIVSLIQIFMRFHYEIFVHHFRIIFPREETNPEFATQPKRNF